MGQGIPSSCASKVLISAALHACLVLVGELDSLSADKTVLFDGKTSSLPQSNSSFFLRDCHDPNALPTLRRKGCSAPRTCHLWGAVASEYVETAAREDSQAIMAEHQL